MKVSPVPLLLHHLGEQALHLMWPPSSDAGLGGGGTREPAQRVETRRKLVPPPLFSEVSWMWGDALLPLPTNCSLEN